MAAGGRSMTIAGQCVRNVRAARNFPISRHTCLNESASRCRKDLMPNSLQKELASLMALLKSRSSACIFSLFFWPREGSWHLLPDAVDLLEGRCMSQALHQGSKVPGGHATVPAPSFSSWGPKHLHDGVLCWAYVLGEHSPPQRGRLPCLGLGHLSPLQLQRCPAPSGALPSGAKSQDVGCLVP